MYKTAIPVGVGILAIALLAAAYFAPPYLHWPLDPAKVIAVAVILACGASLAAVFFIALNRPADGGKPALISPLNADPVKDFIALFREGDPVQITASPGVLLSEIIVRHSALFEKPERSAGKRILLTIKAAKKAVLNPVVLRELFEKLKPLNGFYHVLLMSETEKLIGYIPAAAAIKEFTGENGETKISKFIVDVLADHSKSTVLRKIRGAAREDMILETADIRDAARKFRLDDNNKPRKPDEPPLQGLIVYRNNTPIGFLDKDAIFDLSTTGAA